MIFRRFIALLGTIALGGLGLPVLAVAPAQADASCTLADCSVPTAVIDKTVGTPTHVDVFDETTSTTASFAMASDNPEDTDETFECRLEVVGGPLLKDWSVCVDGEPTTGTFTRSGLAPAHYRFSVRVTVHPRALGTAKTSDPETFQWYVVGKEPGPVGADGAPRTMISNRPHFWHTQNWFSIDLTASEAVHHYNCTFDGMPRRCGARRFDLFGTGPGDHTIAVQAVDLDGNADPTPEVVKLNVPQSAVKMSKLRGFHKSGGYGYMLDQYVWTTKKGASITRHFRGVRKVALVVTKGPRHGAVKVYIGKRLVKKVRLGSSVVRHRQVVVVKKSSRKFRGPLRIVTANNRRVEIEGVGLSRR